MSGNRIWPFLQYWGDGKLWNKKFGWKENNKKRQVPSKPCTVTGWPLVVHWWLTQTVQSFPYRRVLPGPAGFDINTKLWWTEALALGWAPGAPTVHSALLLACWFTVPSGCSLIHFPSQFAHRAPRKPSSSNIFALWFPEESMKKNKPPLTAPVPVNVQRAGRPPLVSALREQQRAAVSQAPCGSSISLLPPLPPPANWSIRDRAGWGTEGTDGVLCACVSLTHPGQMGARAEPCCVCIINMCVGVYAAQRPTWSRH